MILISSSNTDHSTNHVIDWILHFNNTQKIIRINDDEGYELIFKGKQIQLTLNDDIINFSSIKSYWYRRGRIRFIIKEKSHLRDLKQDEEIVIEEYVNFLLSKKRHINDYFNSEPNKLIVLEHAKTVGLLTPNSYIYQNKKDLIKASQEEELITKTILASSMICFENSSSVIYTSVINGRTDIPDKFLPSLFQNKILKKYELRIFYFKNIFWSMAIFSQLDKQTEIDFKMYNHNKPNRTVPFKLPGEIEDKLKKLMKKINLDSGSIDMIITPKNEFVFLEVNPIGQFGMISYPCNYHIEKEIAKYLTHED